MLGERRKRAGAGPNSALVGVCSAYSCAGARDLMQKLDNSRFTVPATIQLPFHCTAIGFAARALHSLHQMARNLAANTSASQG